jgi:ArsR family transcriptional regulator
MTIDTTSEGRQACFLRCIGEPTRLRIINLLGGGELCVGDICRAIGKGQPLVSHHLHALRECGIVCSRQENQRVIYRLRDENLAKLVELTGDIVTRLSPCQATQTAGDAIRRNSSAARPARKADSP